MVKLKDITYVVKDNETGENRTILQNINVEFPANKITVITGHNGSGKSTLVRLIMGINKPTSGDIYIKDKKVNNLSITDRSKMGLVMAFQQPVKFKGITVKDMLSIAGGKETNLSTACEYLAQVGLCAKDYIDRELDDTLSGGELKRIELATALCKGGDILLFDEPEAGIDLWSFDNLVSLFEKQRGKTIIIVSHQKRILDIADYILVLNSKAEPILDKRSKLIKKISTQKCDRLGGDNE